MVKNDIISPILIHPPLSNPTIGIRAGSFINQFNHWKVDHGEKKHSMVFSRFRFPCINIVVLCMCMISHLFIVYLLYIYWIIMLHWYNTWIIWLKRIKFLYYWFTPLSVIQQLVSEQVPSGNSLTTGRRSWIILRMEYQCLMVRMVLSMRCGEEGWKYFYMDRDIIFGY